MSDRDELIEALQAEPQVMTLSHDRLILQRAERDGGQVVVVRCPHTIGLCFLIDYGGDIGEMLGVLPCPCNDRSEVVARVVPGDVTERLDEAVKAWEAKGPTSLTIALLAEAVYAARGSTTPPTDHAAAPTSERGA